MLLCIYIRSNVSTFGSFAKSASCIPTALPPDRLLTQVAVQVRAAALRSCNPLLVHMLYSECRGLSAVFIGESWGDGFIAF